MTPLQVIVTVLVIVLAVLLVRMWLAYRGSKAPQPRLSQRNRRTAQTVHKGYRAHAADIWQVAPDEVTEEMLHAAKRDLHSASYSASLAQRLRWLELNPALPPIPANSVLYAARDLTGLRAPVRGRVTPGLASRTRRDADASPAPSPEPAWAGGGGESGGGGASASWDSSSCDTSSSSSDSGGSCDNGSSGGGD